MAIEYDRTAPVLDNTSVDNIVQQSGEIDQLSSLNLDLPDRDIIRNLNQRINDSEQYWNDAKGFDLKNARAENTRLHLGKVDESGLYKHQKQYKENQIFIGEESIVAYVTSQIAGPLVVPAGREEMHKLFASDLEKAIKCYFGGDVLDFVNIEMLAELWTRDILNKRIAIGHFYYDKDLEEIVLEHKDPEHCILDKNAALGRNPGFVCDVLKRTPEELINEFPDRENELLEHLGIKRKTPKQMTKELAVRKVSVTHYNAKNEPEEGIVWYFDNIVLEKIRNPNYLYSRKDLNLLKFPKKPYIFGNLVNYGTHLIDNTTPLEQAAEMQKYLMRRGRQIAENADKANGILVIGTSSGLSKDDGQNITGDPNQKLFVDNEDGKNLEQLVLQLQAQQLPDYVIQDKQDARMQIGNLMGAPVDFTGNQADDGDPTLGQVMIKKNQAAGRQDLMVRAITRMIGQAYQYYVQMAIVWYDDKPRHFTYDAGDGEFDFITLKRDLIQKGIRVKASKPANPDRSRIEAIILQLLKEKAISLLDAYKILQLDNAQQLYDNWAKQTSDPMALARDALDVVDESEAYVAFQDIMNGKPVDEKQNPSKEYILSLRKLMINDDFLKAKKSLQAKFIKYVNQCLDSLEERLALEEASEIGPPTGEGLRPGAPLPDPNSPLPQAGGQPGAGPAPGAPPMPMPPPQGPGGQLLPPGGLPPQGMPPMGGMPMPPPGGPTPSSVFGGIPIPAPGQAPMPQPGNPGSLPMM
jgi:hypothetical protein